MRSKAFLGLAVPMLAVAVAATAGCGSNGGATIRVGVIADCRGSESFLSDSELAGAELPFIRRGGRLEGDKPLSGVTAIDVAGKKVKLIVRCVLTGVPSATLDALRLLVERDGASAVVAGFWPPHGLLVKEYARSHPDVTFMLASQEQSTTLRGATPNVFRFNLAGTQALAGLGSYAYHTLGWRKAATVSSSWPFGWNEIAGVAAEFCSLGGTVVQRLWPPGDPSAAIGRLPAGVDGVFLAEESRGTGGFTLSWAKLHPQVGQHLLLSTFALRDALAAGVVGVVGESEFPYATTPVWDHYVADLHRSFPGVDPVGPDVLGFNSIEPLLEALEQVHGDVSNGQRRLRDALRHLRYQAPTGGVRWLDRRQQVVGPMYLGRIERDAHGKPYIRQIRVLRNVEQTFNGYFSPATPPPSRTQPVCRKGHVPTWAR